MHEIDNSLFVKPFEEEYKKLQDWLKKVKDNILSLKGNITYFIEEFYDIEGFSLLE